MILKGLAVVCMYLMATLHNPGAMSQTVAVQHAEPCPTPAKVLLDPDRSDKDLRDFNDMVKKYKQFDHSADGNAYFFLIVREFEYQRPFATRSDIDQLLADARLKSHCYHSDVIEILEEIRERRPY